jgi:protein-tyrosine phosphatase
VASSNVKRVSTIAVAGLPGRLVLCPCPGHWDRPGPREPGSDAAVAEDLADLAGRGVIGLLSLLEDHSFPGGVRAFGAAVQRANLTWAHMPIPDYGAPGESFAEPWSKLGLPGRLASGENWAVHCFAGLGRTGLVAAHVLIEAGSSPDDAIAQIRREHAPEAIETEVQVDYLHAI